MLPAFVARLVAKLAYLAAQLKGGGADLAVGVLYMHPHIFKFMLIHVCTSLVLYKLHELFDGSFNAALVDDDAWLRHHGWEHAGHLRR